MADSSCPNVIRFLAFTMLALVLAACSGQQKQQLPPLAEQMAKAYGLDSFGQIEGIRYTERRVSWGQEAFRWRGWHY
jgi:hypothetical protein